VSQPRAAATPTSFTPAHPNLLAFAFLSLWIVILSLPMWSGRFLAGPLSDQQIDGYAIRWWSAAQWRATGHLPQWNPFLFGGHPVFTGFGDLFYPSAWLRFILPTAVAMDVAFVVHYLLAGLFMYWLLRLLQISWLGAVTGATAYQLSGVVVSLMSPGHDGKLFVTTMLPLMLIGLVWAIRNRRSEGYAILGFALGLALLSPQYQMTQYALITAGLFALYLTFGEPGGLAPKDRWLALAGAAGGVVLGFGVSIIQVLPFFHSISYGTRSAEAGYAWSTTYALPWSHVPELLVSGFAGHHETYWGPNGLKLHSEYLGLPVLMLAALGVGSPRRRLVLWLMGIAVLFLLVSMGGATPFYQLWYALVPYVRKTRAAGMALYVVAFAVSSLAALGVERLERGEGKRVSQIALAASAFIALLGTAGVLGSIAQALARPLGHDASAALPGIAAGAVGSAVGLAAIAGIGLGFLTGRLKPAAFATSLVLVVGADLFRAGREFWRWSRPEQEAFRPDPIIQHLQFTPLPYRVLDLPGGVYPGDLLIRHQAPVVLGYSGVELGDYDDLLGGRNQWTHLQSLHLWDLLAIRYAVFTDSVHLPGYHLVMGPVSTAMSQNGFLYEADTVPAYARVVPAAVKGDTGEVIPTLLDPRLDYDLVVIFDRFEPVNPLPLTDQHLPPPSPSKAAFTHWAPGRMSVQLDPPPPAASYLLISENWYPDWHATVDGAAAAVLRGDQAFITVPVPAGARRVELTFASRDYARGRLIMWASLVLLGMWAVAGRLLGNRARRRG